VSVASSLREQESKGRVKGSKGQRVGLFSKKKLIRCTNNFGVSFLQKILLIRGEFAEENTNYNNLKKTNTHILLFTLTLKGQMVKGSKYVWVGSNLSLLQNILSSK